MEQEIKQAPKKEGFFKLNKNVPILTKIVAWLVLLIGVFTICKVLYEIFACGEGCWFPLWVALAITPIIIILSISFFISYSALTTLKAKKIGWKILELALLSGVVLVVYVTIYKYKSGTNDWCFWSLVILILLTFLILLLIDRKKFFEIAS